MAHHVFISYSSQDKSTAEAVCAALEADGVRCWIAPRDILPGVPYGEALSDAIDVSAIMVLVLSTHSNSSRQVMLEVEGATSNSVPIVPLRVEEVQLSKSLKHFLKSIHWFDAVLPPLERHLPQLVAAVKQLLARQGTTLPDPPTRVDSAKAEPPVGDDELSFSARPTPPTGGAVPAPRRRSTPAFDNSLGNRMVLVVPPYLAAGHPSAQALYVSTTCASNQDFRAFIRAGGPPPARLNRNRVDLCTWDWRSHDCPALMLRHPIIHVAHASAVRFCDWLTEKERSEGRIGGHERYALPTLAQWQAFSQGIKLTAKTVIERQWQSGQFQPTEPVDWLDLGPLGLLCLLGNVFEWCGDPPQERPLKKQRPDGTVARWKQACYAAVGGGWASGCQWLDEELKKGTSGRIWCPDGVAMKDGGFRVCLLSEEPASAAG